MPKFISSNELSKLAKALNNKAKNAVSEESSRAQAAEQALQTSINDKATSGHNHNTSYYTKSEINTKVTNLQAEIDNDVKAEADRAKGVEADLQANIDKKANSSHGNHVPTTQTASNKIFLRNDNTWATVTPANIGAAASSHTHDDRYYTETEIDSKVTTLNTAISTAKSDAQTYADNKIAALVDSAPDAMNTLNELAAAIDAHQDVYDAYVQEVTSKLSEKSDTSHTHKYAGSSSAGGAANKVKTSLTIKLNSGATEGTDLFTFNGSAAKTVNITPDSIGAAAESHGTHVTYSTTAPKVAGTAAVGSESTVARGDHVHTAQTSVSGNAGTATKLKTAVNITIGNKSNSFNGSANISYTLADIGASPLQKSVISKSKSGTTLTLSTDRYQKATLASGDTIVLPSVSDFTEINLFVKDCSLTNIILPDDCKWRVDPNLQTGTSFMFTFIYTTQEWLAEVKIYS